MRRLPPRRVCAGIPSSGLGPVLVSSRLSNCAHLSCSARSRAGSACSCSHVILGKYSAGSEMRCYAALGNACSTSKRALPSHLDPPRAAFDRCFAKGDERGFCSARRPETSQAITMAGDLTGRHDGRRPHRPSRWPETSQVITMAGDLTGRHDGRRPHRPSRWPETSQVITMAGDLTGRHDGRRPHRPSR